MNHQKIISGLAGFSIMVILAGCGRSDTQANVPTMPPQQTPDTQPASLDPSPTTVPAVFYMHPALPYSLAQTSSQALLQAGFSQQTTPEGASLLLTLNPEPGTALTTQWIYTVAAPFPTIPNTITWTGLQDYWLTADPAHLPEFSSPPAFVLTQDVADLMIAVIGPPASGLPLTISPPDQLSNAAWNNRPSLSILPFDTLKPSWKVISLDGQSVLDRSLDVNTYPLAFQFGVTAQGEPGQQGLNQLQTAGGWKATNREPSSIIVVTMSGVTALVRATASQMLVKGTNFPAEQIHSFIADADIMHTSNEVSFTPKCPTPEWEGPPTDFCSQPAHFELLQTIGLDVVELTGNHNNDVGTGAFNYSLDLYEEAGIIYYGGGRNLEDALAPRIITAPDGTRIAFVGCNSAGPYTAWATEQTPGAAPCDDWSTIQTTISELKAAGQADLVIVSVQYQERASHEPSNEQVADFEALAAAGADIVSGSQAHQPQGFRFVGGTFIHYGLGNLFFDQPELVNRQMFIDKYIVYQGQHISTVLFTGVIESWGQPRPMLPSEQTDFLNTIFSASGW